MTAVTIKIPSLDTQKQARPHDAPRPVLISSAHGSADKPKNSQLEGLFKLRSFEQHFQPNSTVLLHGDPADAIYFIASGTVRCCTIDPAGNRQIFSFPQKGAVIGISDIDHWHFTAEAVDHVIVRSIPRAHLEQELATNTLLRQEIRALMVTLLTQRERQLLTLSTTKGPERLLRFLQDYAAARPSSSYVVLPMSRRDIGDHIGLSMESVSRAFSHLKRTGQIDLKSCEKYRLIDQPGETTAG